MVTEAAPGRLRADLADRALRYLRAVAKPRSLVVGAAIVIVGYLAVVPLYFLLHDTFTGRGGVTFDAFTRAYGGNSQAGQMMVNSLLFAGGSALLALVVGTVLAYVQVRTDAPFKGLFFAASLVPLIIPGVLYTVAWIFLADPDIGLINTSVVKPIFGSTPFDVYSLWGMIWVQGLHHMPIAFLLMVAAFRAMDPSLEESALMSGASRRAVLRRVTVPLVRPAITAAVLLVFVQSLESFEVPALLGLQNGTYVFTSRIYFVLRSYPIDYGAAGAYGIGLLAIALVGVAISAWLSRNARGYQTVTGKAFRPRPYQLGKARPFVGAGIIVYFVITVVLPMAVLIYASLLKFYRPPSSEAFDTASFDVYRQVIDNPLFVTALKNTILLGVGAATVVMFLSTIASWFVVRTSAPGRRLLDGLTFTPLVIPGLVLGLALLFVYLRVPLPIYGTLVILLISYATRYLPYGMRYAGAAMSQVSSELEESAMVCGASWWQSFRRVLVPLASSGVMAGWVYILIVSFRELSSTILLYSPGNETLSILIFEQFQDGNFTAIAAIGVLMVAILVTLVLIAYRVGAKFGLERDASA